MKFRNHSFQIHFVLTSVCNRKTKHFSNSMISVMKSKFIKNRCSCCKTLYYTVRNAVNVNCYQVIWVRNILSWKKKWNTQNYFVDPSI